MIPATHDAVLALPFEASDEPTRVILNTTEHALALDAPLHDTRGRQRRPGKLDRPSKAIADPLDVEIPSLDGPLPPPVAGPFATSVEIANEIRLIRSTHQ